MFIRVVIISRVEYQWAISPAMARSWLLAVILCVFALHMRTTNQQICSPMNSVPMVDPNSPNTADQIVASCTSVGPSDPISNPVWVPERHGHEREQMSTGLN